MLYKGAFAAASWRDESQDGKKWTGLMRITAAYEIKEGLRFVPVREGFHLLDGHRAPSFSFCSPCYNSKNDVVQALFHGHRAYKVLVLMGVTAAGHRRLIFLGRSRSYSFQPTTFSRHRPHVSYALRRKALGVISMWNSISRTRARRDRVASEGSCSPASRRATWGWRMPSRRARSVWVSWCSTR